jgi:hypothetical protein
MFEKFIKFLLKKNKKTENNLPLNIKKILGKEVTKVKKVVTEDVFEKDFKRLQLISGYYYLYS